MPDVVNLGRRVKEKYPGLYDDLPDGEVGRRVKAKYPGAYDDFTDTAYTPPPERSALSALGTGLAQAGGEYLVEPAVSLYQAGKSAIKGDLGPAKNIAESAVRGSLAIPAGLFGGATGYKAVAGTQAPALAQLRAEREAQLAQTPAGQYVQRRRGQLEAEAAQDTSLTNRVARTAGKVAGAVAPAVAIGTLTGGSTPAIATTTALQSAAQPENAALATTLSVLPVPVGQAFRAGVKAVRRAFGKGAAQIVEAEALPAATAQVRQAIPEVPPVAGETSPAVQNAMQRFEQEVARIKNLPPGQQAAEMEAAIQSIGREASGIRPVSARTRAGYPPQMVMPENPNAIQQAGRLPFDEAPPQLGTELEPPSFNLRAAPEPAYTETAGPSLSEAQGMTLRGPSASAPLDLDAAISDAAESTSRSVGKRVKDELLAVYHLPRSLLSSLDLSAPFRQGALLTVPPTQWGRAARAGVRMFQSFSTKKYNQIVEAIAGHADAPVADEAGLYLATKAEQGLQGAEEAFLSKYAGRIPLVKQSEQAYKTYLDSLRMDTFAKYKRVIDKSGLAPEQAQQAYNAAATWINYATGRGSLGQTIDKAMPALSTVIFSPRYVASRLNVLNPVYYAKNAATAEGRAVLKQQMGELVQYAGVVAGTLALAKAAGADVTLNPNSPDFLKIKAGRWRYDTLAGLQQVMRLIYRAGGDIKNKVMGEKTQGPNALEISGNFLRSKLGPVPGAFVDFVKGRTVTGKPFSGSEAAVKLVAPIQWADFVEAYQKEGLGGVLKASPGFVGFGVQDYDSTPVQAAIEKAQPIFTELQRLNRRVSDLKKKDGEKDDAFNARVRQFSANYTQFGQRLLDNPRFQSAPDAVKGLALDALNSRAKAITSREFAFPELELDANALMDAAEQSKKNPANK